MPSDIEYQKVPCEEEQTVEQTNQLQVNAPLTATTTTTPSATDDSPPPPYDATNQSSTNENHNNELPPMYTDIVKLPSYNESQNIDDGNDDQENNNRNTPSIFLYWLQNNNEEYHGANEETLGSDVGFIFFFLLSFIFNWVGFLIAYCFTNSLSSQYGAITGFGLSLVKWAFIMKHGEYFQDNEMIMYVLVLLGWLVFLRGIFSYIQLKRYLQTRQREEIDPEFMG